MKQCIIVLLILLSLVQAAQARDFMVEFVQENYKETQAAYSNDPVIYHSIQVKTDAGPKLLILTGEDQEYRRWLRQFISRGKIFIARVPDADNDRFISAKAYELDVDNLHPVNGRKWVPGRGGEGAQAIPENQATMLQGDKHILIIDKNDKRTRLITSVINRMGFTAMVSHNGAQALETFKIQPEKFKMIIADYDVPNMTVEELIGGILKVDRQIPILLGTGYNNPIINKKYVSEFSGAGTVTVTPVVLENLQHTIERLVRAKG